LYAELGNFFSADGIFDESTFRAILKESLASVAEQSPPDDTLVEQGKWLSGHLSEIMDYLSTKGMEHAAARLVKAAIDEATNLGITDVMVSTSHLKEILGAIPRSSVARKKRKASQDEKKKKIYMAALKVFAEEGFHQATMNKIAAISGVAKGTVYEYFKSKEDLLDQLLSELNQDIVEKVNTICSKDKDIVQQISDMIEFWVDFIEKNPLLYRLIQSEAIFQRPEGKAMFYDYIISNLPMFKERIVALNKENKLKTTSFYTVFYGILGFIDGVVQKWFRCKMEYPLRDEVPVILEVLFNGFAGEHATHKRFFIPPEEQ